MKYVMKENPMTVHEILENYGFIVHTDENLGFTIAWNGSATFNIFEVRGDRGYRNIDTITDYDVRDVKQAADVAFDYCRMIHNEMLEVA
jgi:hypothetical protein